MFKPVRSLLLALVPALTLLAGCASTGPVMPPASLESPAVREAEMVRRSVVKIETTHQSPNYQHPWAPGRQHNGVGSGFIIDGQRIMTNAHVVSNARFIELIREGQTRRYTAELRFIAHDCDLAILGVDDPTFFEDSVPLQFGDVPKLNSTVVAYGYPVGGRRMSVTRGVVSRIEFNTYSHSGLDQHLTIQVDAAINPGNSGGPIVQDGKVVGVAFQGFRGSVAQNTGYMIPTPVVQRMLEDVKNGRYDGYTELAVFHSNLLNPSFRRYLGLPDNNQAIWVTDVMKNGSADGVILPGDVLLKIDGHVINNDGSIRLSDENVQMEEVVERKFHGDIVTFDILRNGQELQVAVTLKDAEPFKIFSNIYDQEPRFVLFAGLVFQPLSRNVMAAHNIKDPDITFIYRNFIENNIYLERPELIAITAVVPDPINTDVRDFQNSLVDEINGVRIRYLKDVAEALAKPVEYHIIKLYQKGRPIVIEAGQVEAARKRIETRYQILNHQRLGGK